jgi:cytochrome c oxidase cbb3-type subunit I/II
MLLGWASPVRAVMVILALVAVGEFAFISVKYARQEGRAAWHPFIERRGLLFTALLLVSVLVGGIAELVPTLFVRRAVPTLGEAQQPYTALELEGRDLYVREGCYTCHSQMIRPLLAEKARYGAPSRPEEFIYDHPFQWGSKRTGPDLAREGGKRGSDWHFTHLVDPRAMSPGSNMPSFEWLARWKINPKGSSAKLALMAKLGVPYSKVDIDNAEANLLAQAAGIVRELDKQKIKADPQSEMVAMIAYLQRLGRPPAALKADLQANAHANEGGP